jgi:DHA1 family bicyclomycin/chloramphenicol resistance-like MFS transporter
LNPQTPSGQRSDPRGLIVLLAALSMIGPFAIDTFFPAFPAMAKELAASPFQMQQTLSVYLVAYGAMALLHGALSDALGRRPVIIGALWVFALASIGCTFADSLNELLFWRAIQGLSAGPGVIVGRAIVRDCFEGAKAQRVMSGISMLFGIAPAIAPIVGGYLLVFGWRASFAFLTLFTGALLLASLRYLPESHPTAARVPLRVGALAQGYGQMLRNRSFVLLAFAAGFNFAAIFLYIASAPAIVIEHFGFNERQFAHFFVPIIGGMVIGSYLSGRLAGRVATAHVVAVAYAAMIVAGLGNVVYCSLADFEWPVGLLPVAVTAAAVAVTFPQLSLLLLDLFPDRRGSASSLQMFLSLIVNAAVAGLMAPWLQHRPAHLALGALLLTLAGAALCAIGMRSANRAFT